MNRLNLYRSLFIWLVIGVMIILLFNLLSYPKKTEEEMIFSEFMTKLEAGEVANVTIRNALFNDHLPWMKFAITAGVAVSNPTTSNMPPSWGSAMVK